ncbi:hypothetical protein E1A91_D13G244300v1 [Gossypium mustelinum]|uniref:Uncharacterized protein n=1 Tax=Gossypium mustelinum TaxID=34275 RepID=A0A5D2S7E5_GOSMU|nr:hypothetical protein E1A91_D13G244300v1 [Gossypium mustelinum]
MAAGAADGIFWSLYEGCISGNEIGIERRPYHKNCRCALHDKSRGNCPLSIAKSNNVSYPMRRAWSEGCLMMTAAASSSCHSSPSSLPAWAGKHHLGPSKEEDEIDLLGNGKIVKMNTNLIE